MIGRIREEGGTVRADPDSGFWFHGRWIPDPYEWLERFDDPEVKRSYTPAQLVFNSGVESYQAGDLDTAKSKFLEALDMDPTLVAAHSALATIYIENEQYQEALESAQALAAAEPENPRAYRQPCLRRLQGPQRGSADHAPRQRRDRKHAWCARQ